MMSYVTEMFQSQKKSEQLYALSSTTEFAVHSSAHYIEISTLHTNLLQKTMPTFEFLEHIGLRHIQTTWAPSTFNKLVKTSSCYKGG